MRHGYTSCGVLIEDVDHTYLIPDILNYPRSQQLSGFGLECEYCLTGLTICASNKFEYNECDFTVIPTVAWAKLRDAPPNLPILGRSFSTNDQTQIDLLIQRSYGPRIVASPSSKIISCHDLLFLIQMVERQATGTALNHRQPTPISSRFHTLAARM